MSQIVEYIWTDAKGEPRSKTFVFKEIFEKNPELLPISSYDGSSTG
jgi:glutamine synthetase